MKSIHQNQEASRDTAFTYTKEKTANNYDAFDGQPQSLKVNKMRWDTYSTSKVLAGRVTTKTAKWHIDVSVAPNFF